MLIKPDYSKGVYNIPHTVLRNFGIKTGRALGGFAGGNKTLLMVIDAMGTYLLPIIDTTNLTVDFLTSTFPSTTAAAVTSIFTGLSPREHGILEWYMFYECYGDIIKTIPYTPADADSPYTIAEKCNPSKLFGTETMFDKLEKKGVKSSTYIKDDYKNSLYSKFMTHGSRAVGFSHEEDIPKLVEKDGSDFIYIYMDNVDYIQHIYGPNSEQTRKEALRVWKIVREIIARKIDYDIFIMADHGQITTRGIDLIKVPENCPVGGSPRDVFIYCHFKPEGYEAIERNEFTRLLGPEDAGEHANLRARVPEYVILPSGHRGLWFREFNMVGMHGGMSEAEMLVPLMYHGTR